MEDSQQFTVNRRNVMKAAGGAAAGGVLGGAFAGTGLATHDEDEYKGVRVNQVGYPIDEHKHAIVTDHAMDVSSVSTFQVVDAEDGSVVDEGTLSSEMEDDWGTSHTVKWADFTDMIDEPGEYQIVVGDEESYPFTVDEASEVYKEVLRDVGRLYTLKRSTTEVDDSDYTGYEYGPGHEQDAEAIVAEPADNDFLADEDVSPGDTIDVSAGWYDAGDYGKYVNPQAVTVAQLMLAYERNPDAFHVGQFHVDDVVDDEDWGEMPDVLVECKYALRFLEQMQRSSGGLFYKLAGNENFPDDDVAPGEDDMDRYVFGNSSVGTAHACGAFAMAARIYEDHDPEFADEMLSCAEDAWSWLEDNPDLVWEQSVNQDAGSGAYGRADFDEPDRYWAAAELYRTTGDSTYDDWIVDTDLSYDGFDGAVDLPGDVEAPIDWNNPVALGNYAYWKGEGTGAVVDDSEGATGGITSAIWVSERYTGAADVRDVYTTGVYDFFWGHLKSGVSRGLQSIWSIEAYEELGESWIADEEVADYVYGPLHHALGRSATGYSRVTEHGEKSTNNPHDRIVQSQNEEVALPGMLVGGGQLSDIGEEGDCTSDHAQDLVGTGDHLEAYVDQHCSYATNEWAINYTAPLFMMLAEVVGEIEETPEPDYATSEPPEEGACEENGAEAGEELDDGRTVCDVDGDGEYRDVTGDGSVTNADVNEFFRNQHASPMDDRADLFDFTGDDDVSQADVVELFSSLN